MLHLYQSNRLERLADLLSQVTSQPLTDPLAAEILVVPHPGMGRWLALRLAERQGVCANVDFPLPAGFIWQMFRRLLSQVPEQDDYAPTLLQWRLFQLLEQCRDEPWAAPLQHYLTRQDERGRLALAHRLALCFDQYLVYRPDWILRWERNQPAVDGDRWQAELWRRLNAISGGGHWVHLQQRLFHVLDQGGDAVGALPQRVSLFGISSLSPGYLEILQRLAARMEVHLFLLNPCETYWTGIVTPTEKAGRELAGGSEALYLEVGNPLLASLGRQGRDLFAALLERDPDTHDLFEPPLSETLLHRLQDDILQLRDGSSEAPRAVMDGDDSIRIHSCHSPMREVEVLHDQLLDLFQRRPDLQPEQVLVMTPDMDGYAPYIEAVFGAAGERRIPFSIADRSPVAENRLLGAFLQLLDGIGGRHTIDEMLALLEVPALQRRFGIDDGDLPRLTRWLIEAGVRWGRDAESRAALELPATAQNSWRFGLQRLLLGVALPGEDEQLFQGILPCDQAEGSEARLLGGLAAFAEAVFALDESLAGPLTMVQWQSRLQQLLERFFQPLGEETVQLQAVLDLLAGFFAPANGAGVGQEVGLDLVRDQLSRLARGQPGEGGFLAGGVTCCALAPMRALPFRVICLIGMNDASFPRDRHPPGFDLMAGSYRPGDRSQRAEDRYLFLETLLSARDCLYISYMGQDQRENTPLPPSTLVSELLEYLQRSFALPEPDRWPLRHPLQPFDARYFTGHGALFSYSDQMAQAARAAQASARPLTDLISARLPEPDPAWRQLTLPQLLSFYANPTRFLLRQRLGLLLQQDDELPESRDPFDYGWFDGQRLQQRQVEALLDGQPLDRVMMLERSAGRLPHGRAGELCFQQLAEDAAQVADQVATQRLRPEGGRLEIDIELAPFRLRGWLDDIGEQGLVGYSVKPLPSSRLLALWIRHLLLNLASPEGIPLETRWLQGGELIRFPPEPAAEDHLQTLLHHYWQGLQQPLHLFPRSAHAYAAALLADKGEEKGLQLAWKAWQGAGGYSHAESSDPYYRLAFPHGDVLDEAFQAQSEALFGPLLAAMESAQ